MVTKVGNLRVYCNGKIFVGPDWKSLLVSFLLIFLPSVLYLSLIALNMEPCIFWLGFIMAMFNLTSLGLTGLSNPGVIPRRPAPSGSNARMLPSSRTKDFKINGYTISTKYCTTCQIYRVPRCSHCAMTDNCVEKFDHYCPWVGTCIGRRNYRFFLMFVFSGTALCLLVCTTSLLRLIEISNDEDDEFDTALRREPVAIILVIYTFGAVWFVGGLSAFHTYLVLTNQTTYEHIRRRFGQHGNPYDKGILMNSFEACCKPNPPYDWESDGTENQNIQESSRMEVPAGVVLNPTIIAMEQAAQERAARAQRANANQASEVGASSQMITAIKDRTASVLEYPDSLYSSSSSLEGRQHGMTAMSFPQRPFAQTNKNMTENRQPQIEITQEEMLAEQAESSSVSLERRPSSKQSMAESASRRPSMSGTTPSANKDALPPVANVDRRLSRQFAPTQEELCRTSGSRVSEMEMSPVRSGVKRTGQSFASVHDESDSNQMDVATTLSSLTSNATSDVSSYKTERSEFHYRKHERHRKHRQRDVMTMQEIMGSRQSIPDLTLGRKQSVNLERRRGSSGEPRSKRVFFSSDGLARLRSLRASGENVLNNLRSMIKKHGRDSQEVPEPDAHEETVESVVIEMDPSVQGSSEKETGGVTEASSERPQQDDRLNEEGHGLRVWVPQLTPIAQQKYTELKDVPPSPFEVSTNEDTPSQEVISVNSTSSANNCTRDIPVRIETTFESPQSQIPRPGNEEDVEALL